MNIPLRLAILKSSLRTQVQVSAVTGIPEVRLSRIVNGWISPRRAECQAIATALGCPVEDLFGDKSGGSAAA
jgi:hypothetical protein